MALKQPCCFLVTATTRFSFPERARLLTMPGLTPLS